MADTLYADLDPVTSMLGNDSYVIVRAGVAYRLTSPLSFEGTVHLRAGNIFRLYNSASSNWGEFKCSSTDAGAAIDLTDGSGNGIHLDGMGRVLLDTLSNAANDAAAASAGVPVDGLYRNGSVLMVRVS